MDTEKLKQIRNKSMFALTLIICIFLANYTQLYATWEQPNDIKHEEFTTLPNNNALKIISFGYNTVAADFIWLRALQYNDLLNKNNLIQRFANAVITLDPDFKPIYKWASTSLIFTANNQKSIIDEANHYLQLAAHRFPNIAAYNYDTALNLIAHTKANSPQERRKINDEAITYLQKAMHAPNPPENIPMLISGLLDDDTNAKLLFLNQALMTENDPKVANLIRLRIYTMTSEDQRLQIQKLDTKKQQWQLNHKPWLPIMMDAILTYTD